ncbi:hypothetical protein R4J03_08240 [Brachyspira intermedia]|uniref:hypothetical protein n=1 Tax=Brachyspira intermedia TaxID=84377 RepID=UPI00261EC341|nr:hypothetical protein [uncultured Brachyspira sp.]
MLENEENEKNIEELIMEYFTDIFIQKNINKKNLTMFDKIILDSSNKKNESNIDHQLLDEKYSIIKNITHDYLEKYLEINDIICFSIPNDNFILYDEAEEDEENKVVGYSKNLPNEKTVKLNYIDSDLPVYLTFDNSNIYVTGNIECIENIPLELWIINLKTKEKKRLCMFKDTLFSNYNQEDIFYEKNRIFIIKKST